MIKITSTFITIAILLAAACTSGQKELEQLVLEKHRLNCEMERLKMQNDSFWIEMSLYLDQILPVDMPGHERTNMVNTRNAYLLTLFRIFPSLDSTVQQKVFLAKEKDDALAADMKEIMARYDEAERKLNQKLEGLEHRADFAKIKQNLKEIGKQPCK